MKKEEVRETEKKKREKKIFWTHVWLRSVAAILGLTLFIIVPLFVGTLGWGVVWLTKWVWTGAAN